MCCKTENQSHNSCCNHNSDSQLWSKKKKLRILEHKLECFEEKKKDIQEAIDELKAEA